MGCISSKKDKQTYCIEFELSLVAQIVKNKKKSGCHESQSSLNFSQKLNKSKCSHSFSSSHLSPTMCEDCSGSCSENTNDSHSPSSSKVREKSLCKGDLLDNKIPKKCENQLDRDKQPQTITCDHINALCDPNSLNIKCIYIYAKEYIVGIKIDHSIGGYCGESKSVLHTSSYEYYNEKYLIIEPNEMITEIETTQDEVGIYGLKFTTSNGRNLELFGDEQKFINCMSSEEKKKTIKTTTKLFNSYGHVLVGLKTEFEDHLTSLACYTCSKDSLKPVVVNASIKAKPKSSDNKITAIRESNTPFSHITSQKQVRGQSKFGRLDLLPKHQQDSPSGRLSTIKEIENM